MKRWSRAMRVVVSVTLSSSRTTGFWVALACPFRVEYCIYRQSLEIVMDEACVYEKPTLTLRELEAQITELAGHLNAANYCWLSLIAEFDRRHGWSDGATQSCAHWLN